MYLSAVTMYLSAVTMYLSAVAFLLSPYFTTANKGKKNVRY
jgi:hypothetical protein